MRVDIVSLVRKLYDNDLLDILVDKLRIVPERFRWSKLMYMSYAVMSI